MGYSIALITRRLFRSSGIAPKIERGCILISKTFISWQASVSTTWSRIVYSEDHLITSQALLSLLEISSTLYLATMVRSYLQIPVSIAQILRRQCPRLAP